MNIALLDGLALLLTRNSKEAVAVSARRNARSFTLYLAKNDNSQPSAERQYMKRLLMFAQEKIPPEDILFEAILYTKVKIVSRCRKLIAVLKARNLEPKNKNQLQISTDDFRYQQLEAQYRGETSAGTQSCKPLVDSIDAFFFS